MKNSIIPKKENLNFIVLVITLITVLISSILITTQQMTLLNYSYILIGIGIISLILYIMSKRKCFKFSKFEIIVFILIILAILSLFSAFNIKQALFGRAMRGEGLYVILTYYILALLASTITDKKQIKVIVYIILLIGFVNIVYGSMQTGIINQDMFKVYEKWHYAKGFNGNSMYYGSLLSICYPITLGLLIKVNTKHKKIIFGIISVIFAYGSLLSGSMAVLFSEILVFLFIFIGWLIKKIKSDNKEIWKDFIKIVLSIIIFIVLIFVLDSKNHVIGKDIKEMQTESFNIATGNNVSDNYGNGRIYIWKKTVEKIKKYPLGVGIDNYSYAFDKPLVDAKSNAYVFKAHNEYLQIMICEGVITGILYVIFLVLLALNNYNSKDELYYALFLGFISYSIQAFFGISITRVSPVFFIIIGILMGNKKILDRKRIE